MSTEWMKGPLDEVERSHGGEAGASPLTPFLIFKRVLLSWCCIHGVYSRKSCDAVHLSGSCNQSTQCCHDLRYSRRHPYVLSTPPAIGNNCSVLLDLLFLECLLSGLMWWPFPLSSCIISCVFSAHIPGSFILSTNTIASCGCTTIYSFGLLGAGLSHTS